MWKCHKCGKPVYFGKVCDFLDIFVREFDNLGIVI
jgi:hypothetical protein